MKILFVNNSKGRGGGEEFLRDLLPGLADKGVDIGLLCRPGTPLAEMFLGTKIKIHPIERSGRHGVSALFKTASVIRSGRYDIINIQRSHDIIQSWLASRISGQRSVLIYTVQVAEFMRSKFLLSRMERIVTISRHIRDKIKLYAPAIDSRLSIIYYGIDLTSFSTVKATRGKIRSRFGIQSETCIIGTVGDLWKNQIEFLDALVLIRKNIADARFAVVGSDSGSREVEAFKQRASVLGLTDALLWFGRLSKEQMISFYADIDIAVSTHRNEGFGIWVLEALAVGTPVVSVNEGGIRDSLEGCPAGVLVNGGSDAMAHAVVRILKDSALRTQMSKAGPKWTAERFGKERMIDDYFRFFTELTRKERFTRARAVARQGEE